MEHEGVSHQGGVFGYITLIRYGNCIMSGVAAFLGAFVASGRGVTGHLPDVALAVVVVFLFTGAGNTLNDYLDADIDAKAHPERPIPSGRIRRESAKWMSASLFAAAFLFSIAVGIYSVAIVSISLALMLAYEFSLKKKGLAGNLVIAWLTASLFLYGAVAVGTAWPIWALFVTSFLATLGREIIKDVQDMNSDMGVRKTLPMAVGGKAALAVSAAALAGAIAVSPFPYLLGQFGIFFLAVVIAADLTFIYALKVQWKNAGKAQNVAKGAMYVALLAFLIGATGV